MQNDKNKKNNSKSCEGALDLSNIPIHTIVDLIAGFVGGTAQVFVAQPFDTVKVKEQTFPNLYKNMIDCFIKTYRNEGIIHGLYSGTLPAWFANVGESSVLFAAYGGCRDFVAYLMGIENSKDLPLFGEALAGSLASVFSTFVLCPTELIKCKLQAENEVRFTSKARHNLVIPHLTVTQLVRKIYITDGIRGFYRGLGSTFVREIPGYFFFFGCYEGTRSYFTKPGQSKDDVGPLVTILAGALAGIFLWTVTFPADVIKSRIQVNNLSGGMISVGRKIVRKEGVRALYNGLLPSVIRTIPATATLFLVYEFTKKTLSNYVGVYR